jgi:hypothetical protein
MAKKPKISKTQAVRDYLKDHPGAMSGEIAAALNKQGITITPDHVATIKTKENRAAKKAAKKPVAAVEAAPAVVEKPTNGGTITLEQIKKVAHTIKTLGGLQRVGEVLSLIKELGGVKKFKDLAEAMTVTGTEATTLTSTDEVPF